jgi:tRNA 2-selenouridine synthase
VAHWQALSRAGQTAEMVALLLAQHYDPGYESSTQRNFAHYAQAPVLTLNGIGQADMAQAAQALQDLSASVR